MKSTTKKKIYTDEDRERALSLYLDLDDFEEVSAETEFSLNTLKYWAKKYKWSEIKEARKSVEPYNPEKYDDEFDEYASKLNLTISDRKTYKDIRLIEDVCVSSIVGTKVPGVTGLEPEDFKDALAGLRACWTAKDKILSRTMKEASGEDKPGTVNLIGSLTVNRGKNETIEMSPRSLVSGREHDP